MNATDTHTQRSLITKAESLRRLRVAAIQRRVRLAALRLPLSASMYRIERRLLRFSDNCAKLSAR